MKVGFVEIGQVEDKLLKFAVISARMNGQWLFVQHKERDTWEIPGGHREDGEYLGDTAKRELYEETGAIDFDIRPICDYSVTNEGEASYGRLYIAEVRELGELPAMEIREVAQYKTIPEALTYPAIQPYLYSRVLQELTCDYLGKRVKVVMDRPLGSKHPKYDDMIYPINYGYIPDTVSGDGMEIDAYVIGEFQPLESYEGYVVAVIKRIDDLEHKLVVASEVGRYTKEQIRALTEFQERFYTSEIIDESK